MVSMLGLAGEAAEVARKSTNAWHALRYLCSVLTAKCASSLRRCVPKLREVLSCWNVSHAGPMRFTSAVKESSASLRAASLRALVVLGSCGLTGAGDMGWGVSGLPRALGPGFVGPGRVEAASGAVCDRCWGWFEGGRRKRRLCGAGLGAGGALPPLRSSGRLLRGLALCKQGAGRGVPCESSGSLGLYVLVLGWAWLPQWSVLSV